MPAPATATLRPEDGEEPGAVLKAGASSARRLVTLALAQPRAHDDRPVVVAVEPRRPLLALPRGTPAHDGGDLEDAPPTRQHPDEELRRLVLGLVEDHLSGDVRP